MKRLQILIFSGVILQMLPIAAQELNSVYENNSLISFEKYIYTGDSSFHTSIRPYFIPEMRKAFSYDSLKNLYGIEKFRNKKALNLIFNRSWILLKKKDYGFTIDPQVDFGTGYDSKNDFSTWINTRGVLIEGYLGKNFAFSTRYYETQSTPPLWISDFVNTRYVMPGQGRVKFEGKGFDYPVASGYISWSPSKFFNLQLGHGKQFFGDGYRSLMLSDVSSNHPYFMIATSFWKIKLINLYSQYSHPDVRFNYAGSEVYARKYSSMHYLSYTPGRKWEISLFESIIWQASDTGYYHGFDFNYLNPVVFYRPVELDFGQTGGNNLMGFNLRFMATKGTVIYGQFVFDEFRIREMTSDRKWSGNKYALQAGLKAFDLFKIKNLNLQAEYNFIRPYMYSHYALVQNYSHQRQPLAHPDGANVKEAVFIAKYNYKRLYLNLKYVWAGAGFDIGKINYGKNIFENYKDHPNDYGNYIGQGLYTTLNQFDASLSYLINPVTNMNFFVAATFRHEQSSQVNRGYSYFSFGLRTSLRNLYYDFF